MHYGIVTKNGWNAPCTIEREGTCRRTGRRTVRTRYYDSAGSYNSPVDFYADDVQIVDYRPEPKN